MASHNLMNRLNDARRRLLLIGAATALGWGLTAMIVLALFAAWLDLLWELSPQWRIAAICAAGTFGAVSAIVLVILTIRSGSDAAVARRVDSAADSGGRVLTGLELEVRLRSGAQSAAQLTTGLSGMAVERAANLARGVPLPKVVSARPMVRMSLTLSGLAVALILLAICMPGLTGTQWNRFIHPWEDVPPFATIEFIVEPGNKDDVIYGSELDIRATVLGTAVNQVELVMQGEDGREETLPMFPEPDSHWRAALAKVTEPASYFVRSYKARSRKYHLGVITVPRIENVRLRISPPEYANRAAYEGPLPKEGIAAFQGTEVQIRAASNRPLSSGKLTVFPAAERSTALSAANRSVESAPPPIELQMRPTSSGSLEVAGSFQVAGDGRFELRVIDVAGQASQQSFSGTITVLPDERPLIRILQPRPLSLATPNTMLPVVVSAEDDCGISRVQLFRRLNESRPLPADMPVAKKPPRRAYQQVALPLALYGLKPGDVIKLFGRVEDNDPAGVKGAESSVVSVQIISQEDFERMLQVREGLEVLASKYREAQRRMESLAAEVEKLEKELQNLPADDPLSQEIRRKLSELQKQLETAAESLEKLSDQSLPFDIDKNLSPQLDRLMKLTADAAGDLEKLLKEADIHNEAARRQLEKIGKELAAGRKQFDNAALSPLEHLEDVFPLMADQSRFVMLVLHQQDLADRLAALNGHDREDNPAIKTRMRDLEQEQRQVHELLGQLLDDIENHATRLPDKPEFEKLRQTAGDFVKEVRASGASAAMAEAQAALAEFSGTRAAEKGKLAADILEKFLKSCDGMGSCAGNCLVFDPTLSAGLGNTVSQLLAAMGLSAGGGYGSGFSGINGVGLYGSMPGMNRSIGGDPSASGAAVEGGGDFSLGGTNPDEPTAADASAAGNAAGATDASVPLRYRRQVGKYFQRIIEEVEKK
jgi:hypothetical protein